MGTKETSSKEREVRQRSAGFIVISTLFHVGVLAALAAANAPLGNAETDAAVNGSGDSDAVAITEVTNAPPAELTEVIVADAADTTAVPVPAEVLKPAQPAKAVEAALPAKKTAPKKVAKTLPPAVKAPEAMTDDNSDVEAALEAPVEAVAAQAPIEVTEQEGEAVVETPTEATTSATTAETTVAEAPAKKEEVKPEPAAEPVAVAAPVAAPTEAVPAEAAPVATAPAQAAPAASTAAPVNAVQGQTTSAGTGTGNGVGGTLGGGAVGVAAAPAVRESTQLRPLPGNPKPVYPQQDRLLKRQGLAVLRAYIRADGSVGQVVLEKSSGSPLMDQSALSTYKNWRYYPGQEGPVRHRIAFQLTGEAQEARSKLRTR